jgi:hypothetical protein
MCGLEILALCIRCYKCLLAYHKANAIIVMKKHMEIECKTLFAKYLGYVASHLKFPLDRKLTNKRPHITSTAIFEFFDVTITHLQRIMVHRRVS